MALDVVESWVRAAWSSSTEFWIWCKSPRSARPNRWATDRLVLLSSCLCVEMWSLLIWLSESWIWGRRLVAEIMLEGRSWGELELRSVGRWSTASAIKKIGDWKQMIEWESGMSKVTSLERAGIMTASIMGMNMITFSHWSWNVKRGVSCKT